MILKLSSKPKWFYDSTTRSLPEAFPCSASQSLAVLFRAKCDKTFSSFCSAAKSEFSRSEKGLRCSSSSCSAPLGGAGEFPQRAEHAPAPAALRNFPSTEQAGKEKFLGSPCELAKRARGRQLRALVCLGSLGPCWSHSWQALWEGTRAGCARASAPVRARPSGYPEPRTCQRTSPPGFGSGEPICAR